VRFRWPFRRRDPEPELWPYLREDLSWGLLERLPGVPLKEAEDRPTFCCYHSAMAEIRQRQSSWYRGCIKLSLKAKKQTELR